MDDIERMIKNGDEVAAKEVLEMAARASVAELWVDPTWQLNSRVGNAISEEVKDAMACAFYDGVNFASSLITRARKGSGE